MTLETVFTWRFTKQFNRYDTRFRDLIAEKIEEFKDSSNHEHLRVHKLHGRLHGRFSFSVDYRTHIIFIYLSKTEAVLLTIGDHEVYD